MIERKHTNNPLQSRYIQMLLNFILVSVMLTCFALIVGYSIHTIYPTWGRLWFPILTFMITFLSLLVHYTQQVTPQFGQDKFIFILLEVVLLVLIARLVSLLSLVFLGLAVVWQEILSWQQDFLQNFFSVDMLLRTAALIVIWLLAWAFSFPLNKLEEDEVLMEQEKQGFTFTDRYQARRTLISLIFYIGFVMIILMVIWKSNRLELLKDPLPSGFFVAVLLVYFCTAFVFLALNQYAIMKARWYFSNVQVTPDLSKRWLIYSLVFIMSVLVIIAFLPTGFSLNIPDIVFWIFEAVVYVLLLVFSLLISPFVFLMDLVARQFNGQSFEEPFEPFTPETPPLIPQSPGGMPWWDVIRSILFWSVFLAVIIFTTSFYIRNRPNLKSFFNELKIAEWLKDLWQWITAGFQQAKRYAKESIQKGFDRIQSFLQNQQEKLPSLADFAKRMPPRQAVILVYIDWIRWNRRHGLVRVKSQTPKEFAQTYAQHFPNTEDVSESVNRLTETFIQARYSRQDILKDHAHEAQRLSGLIKKNFLLQKDLQESQT